ncbi:EamA family transporter [Actinocorallia sp. A-T 12471]|uniref:EamA family transporter n=1 Tax=Actinocorallia sp. A-T 12471 TaxID=3089813 RepID=UPI0029D10313|nr:EamA family transporter [Actinocorallia sp. A-T 12471]MDX6740557.1 EamA family transporter [Actinocorallia sp. A-T 12471]
MSAPQAGEARSGGILGLGSVPPSLLVLCGILSVQIGAGLAKGMFDRMPPSSIVVLRLAASAVIVGFVVRRRLWRVVRGASRRDLGAAAALGGSLALMNFSIYQSLQHIPLGIAVTIEFLGPLSVAVIASRRPRDLVWAALAFGGVVALARDGGDVNVPGVLWALLAGLGWALYIYAAAAAGRRLPGATGLALASVIATALVLPPGIVALHDAGWSVLTPELLALGIGVGLLSSVVPYTLELEALRRIPQGVFGILMSLEPAVAALVGVLLLGEHLSAVQWLAIGAVMLACAGATRSARS